MPRLWQLLSQTLAKKRQASRTPLVAECSPARRFCLLDTSQVAEIIAALQMKLSTENYPALRRIKNFCRPSSTSSRRWLKTVDRNVTTPVERPGASSVTSSAG